MHRGLDTMRGMQGHDPKTVHTCSFGSGRMCPGAPITLERQHFIATLLAPYLCIIGA